MFSDNIRINDFDKLKNAHISNLNPDSSQGNTYRNAKNETI